MHENCGRKQADNKQADNKQADSRRTLRVFFTQISTVGWGGLVWLCTSTICTALHILSPPPPTCLADKDCRNKHLKKNINKNWKHLKVIWYKFFFFLAHFRLFQCPKYATKHYKGHNALGHGSTFDLLFKQSGRSLLLSVLQSVPRLENKQGVCSPSCPLLCYPARPHATRGARGDLCLCTALCSNTKCTVAASTFSLFQNWADSSSHSRTTRSHGTRGFITNTPASNFQSHPAV